MDKLILYFGELYYFRTIAIVLAYVSKMFMVRLPEIFKNKERPQTLNMLTQKSTSKHKIIKIIRTHIFTRSPDHTF